MLRASVSLLLLLTLSMAQANDGLISADSPHSVPVTVDRLTAALEKKGMHIFDRIDHSAGARKVDKTLRPTVLLIFGNPKIGTALMQCRQSAGIDLPLKFLVWENDDGQVQVTYNDPAYLAQRHGITGCSAVLKKMTKALAGFAAAATAP